MFERTSKTKTFLVVDEDFRILAYFSLALKSLKLDDSVTKSKVKKINALSKEIREVPVYLLGQFGKNDPYSDLITGSEILEAYMFPLIADVVKLVGGRIVLVECSNKPSLIEFYEMNGFIYLQQEGPLTQMIRFLV